MMLLFHGITDGIEGMTSGFFPEAWPVRVKVMHKQYPWTGRLSKRVKERPALL